ncbi:hypothetical protein COCVIDRAFT_20351 [Bipolaris victoriae FI3]|uniref:Uncharacterized protein n=1 Tax=Bipolaris victoriae (strain FI3) TaxID=930091 RepID=W7E738_BIPV3|nr:hypothetical protein COCVIDRAFT_20351 [Bipolaris victoriae FI3]
MSHHVKYSVLASLLATTPHAQSSSNSGSQTLTCDDLSGGLAYYASVTHNTTAIKFAYLGANDGVTISRDDTATWKISSRIGPAYDSDGVMSSENQTQTVLWLDTEDTDMERLGDHIGLCHNYIPLQDHRTGNMTWSREVLERSQQDNGDCKTMLGEDCVAALERWYAGQGLSVWSTDRYPACTAIQNTMPPECEGMLTEPVTMDALALNTSAEDRVWRWDRGVNVTSYPEGATVPTCGDRNLSRSWGDRIYSTTEYDLALNFPIVDIMMFYPTVPVTRDVSTRSIYTEVICLKPENIQGNSRAPRTAKDVLDKNYGPQDDESSAERAFGWGSRPALAPVVSMVVVVWLGV